MSASKISSVPYTFQDRQWDARFNLPTDEELEDFIQHGRDLFATNRLRYLLIGGVEIGEKPLQDDYKIKHVHVAMLFVNPITKSAILKHLGVKQGYGYYLVPRNRNLPYSGWRNHHAKLNSKCDPTRPILLELGTLPEDDKRKFTLRSDEEKKRKVDEICTEMYDMVKRQCTDEEIFKRFPRNFLQYGERIKSMMHQRKDFFKSNGDPHIWIYGGAGSGKSALLNYIYPNVYKKNLYNRFFDLYDPEKHTHVSLEDLDYKAIETLNINFIKTLCDEGGFSFDQKYKTPQPARTTVLVTSQFTISQLLQDTDGYTQNVAAFERRFWQIKVWEIHRILGIKLRDKYEIKVLKSQGNEDPSKVFIAWNYTDDMPSLHPLPTPEEAQKMIREAYYKV